jgi:hypothetical protein
MPVITPRICGICPVSHHLGAAKAGDAILGVELTRPAKLLRELMHMGQTLQSHALHFFHLASPDLLLGMDADPAKRNVIGLIAENPELAVKGVKLSRSRPYFENDNRFVEQKNSTEIRAYVGYDRLDTVDQTNLLNQLYDKLWLYYNLFQPVMRLTEKYLVPSSNGSHHVRRRYDDAKTPFDRLCASAILDPMTLNHLQQLRQAINPRVLREEIYQLIVQLHRLPCASEKQSEDVCQTLFDQPIAMKGEDISVTLSNGRTISVE